MPTPEQRIRAVYGFDFPDDFFRFREFLGRVPEDVLWDVCGISAGYPFDLAAGQLPKKYPDQPIWESRHYNDLPEFVTVLHGHTDGLHWGYFFDAPGDLSPVVASYYSRDSFEHREDGDSLFAAVRLSIEYRVRDNLGYAEDSEQDADPYWERIARLTDVRGLLNEFWGADRQETGEEYLNNCFDETARDPVAETWSQLGIVVPQTWYRPLSADPASGYQLQWNGGQVEALSAEAMTALRQGCPGSALKLGHDLWLWAGQYPVCYDLLEAAYTSLDRGPLIRLMHEARAFRAHCDSRRR